MKHSHIWDSAVHPARVAAVSVGICLLSLGVLSSGRTIDGPERGGCECAEASHCGEGNHCVNGSCCELVETPWIVATRGLGDSCVTALYPTWVLGDEPEQGSGGLPGTISGDALSARSILSGFMVQGYDVKADPAADQAAQSSYALYARSFAHFSARSS
jgi:hypothetical protein